jgi:membrane-associated phospholipid phosphatase
MFQSNSTWQFITHLGSASLLMPCLGVALIELWISHQKSAIYQWIIALSIGVILTLISKVLFLGWGVGIASLNFTGISGHAFLATSIIPILFYSFSGGLQEKTKNNGFWIGLILSFLVGISRIILGMHSLSEVVSGWILGLTVCIFVLNAIKYQEQRYSSLHLLILVFIVSIGSTTPNYLPTHDIEIKFALYLSGHDKPFTRDILKSSNHQSLLMIK